MPGSSTAPATERIQPGAGEVSSERALIVVVALATMLAPLNSTMIVVALPLIIRDFHASLAGAGWLVTAYLIVMASVQPVAGKLGDRVGRRVLILGGLGYFLVASLGAALAPSLPILIAFRVQQAIAASAALPNAFALVRDVVPGSRRAGTFGLIGAATGLAAAAGPPLGGAIVALGGWRGTFAVNILLVVPAVVIGWRILPRLPRAGSQTRFDLIGAGWLLALLFGIAVLTTRAGSIDRLELAAGAAALAVAIALFVWREARHRDPVFQPRLFTRPAFAGSSAGVALSNMAMYTTLLGVPILLAHERHLSSPQIGLVLASMTATNLALAPIGGWIADRWGRRRPVVVGSAATALGVATLALQHGAIDLRILLPALALIGVGVGISWPGLQTSSVEAVAPSDAGIASGIFSTSRYLGSIVGSSVLAVILSAYHDQPDGFQLTFVILFVAALGAVVASLFLQDHPTPQG